MSNMLQSVSLTDNQKKNNGDLTPKSFHNLDNFRESIKPVKQQVKQTFIQVADND